MGVHMGVWPGARPAGAVKARGRVLVPGLRREVFGHLVVGESRVRHRSAP